MSVIAPGSTIGIIGGGQLGRMLAIAAAQLGYRVHVFAPDADSIAAQVAADFTCAAYDDVAALEQFAGNCAVVTYEFENVPTGPLAAVAVTLRPGVAALEVAQSRIDEKRFVTKLGGRTAPFALAETCAGLAIAVETVGLPAIAKTNRFGYDGKGQVRLGFGDGHVGDLPLTWCDLGEQPVLVEGFVDFTHEFSVILARGMDGESVFWPVTHNVHVNGILARTTLPPPPAVTAQIAEARALAQKIADALDYVGVLTCEFFVGSDGPVFNEMAPRVHNSGHWSIEGAVTSQFENHIRAICGLPLGGTAMLAPAAEMRNLVGDEADDWWTLLSDPANHVHLYGKGEPRPGRKMGHVTRLTTEPV